MKKSLFLLPLLAGLALCGCDKKTDSKTTKKTAEVINGEPFVIDADTVGVSSIGDDYAYPKDSGLGFKAGGVSWMTNLKVGHPAPKYNTELNGVKLIQFGGTSSKSTEDGEMYNTEGVKGFTKVTVVFYATYSTEAPTYFVGVEQGETAASLSTVAATETETLNGELDSNFNFGTSTSPQNPYKYTLHFNLNADQGFFKIRGGAGAKYVLSISFEK